MKNISIPFLILLGVGGILLSNFLLSSSKKSPMDLIQKVLYKIRNKYGTSIARNVERIYRVETANFKSGGFAKTFSAGMEAFGDRYPWGWNISAQGIWERHPEYRPSTTIKLREGPGLLGDGGRLKEFIVFPNLEGAMMTLADFLKRHNNNGGRWFSKIKERQDIYNNKLSKIKTAYT